MSKLDELRDYYDNEDMSDSIRRAQPDTRVADEVMVSTSIRLPQSLMAQVRERAAAAGIPATRLMRLWILERLGTDEATAVISVAELERFIAEHAHRPAA